MKTAVIVVGTLLFLLGVTIVSIHDRPIGNGYTVRFMTFSDSAIVTAWVFMLVGVLLFLFGLVSKRS